MSISSLVVKCDKLTLIEFLAKFKSFVTAKTDFDGAFLLEHAVLVETYKTHPLYKKRVKYSKKYVAHDEKNVAKEGDTVRITATRPLSKTKRYTLVKVVEKAVVL